MTNPPANPANPPTVVLYDGACRFCCRQIDRLRWWDSAGKLDYVSLHDPQVAERWPEVDRDRLLDEMCIVDAQGRQHWGADAVRFVSRHLKRLWWLAPAMHFPGAMWLWHPLYRTIARNRYRLMGRTEECESGSCRVHR